MKQDFDLLEELKRNKWPLAGMSVAVFILTLLLFSKGSDPLSSRQVEEKEFPTEESRPIEKKDGVLLDLSEQLFEADRFSLAGPVRFFIRGAGTNLVQFQRKMYELDESILDPRAFPGTEFVRYHKETRTNPKMPGRTNGGKR